MKNKMVAIFSAIIVQSIQSPSTFASTIEFHPDRAIYAGNGCPQNSTDITVDEFGDLYIDHSELALVLPALGADEALAGRKTCIVRVPARIPQGFYIKSIEQQLYYSVAKSAGATLELASRAGFSGDLVRPLQVSLPEGEEDYNEFAIASRHDQLESARQRARYCREDRSEETILQVQIAMSGQRESIFDDLVGAAYGHHFGEGIEIELGSCD